MDTEKFRVYESHPKLKKRVGTETEKTSVKRRKTPSIVMSRKQVPSQSKEKDNSVSRLEPIVGRSP